jgi:hypothetical protein
MNIPIVHPPPSPLSKLTLDNLTELLKKSYPESMINDVVFIPNTITLFPRGHYKTQWMRSQYLEWIDDTPTIIPPQPVSDVEISTFKDVDLHKLGFGWNFWNMHAIENRQQEPNGWNTSITEPFVLYTDIEPPIIPMPKEFQGGGLMVKQVRTYDEYKLPLYACTAINDEVYYDLDRDRYIEFLSADYPIDSISSIRRFQLLNKENEYYLYDVEVPIEYITKKPEEIPVHWIVQEENAERRHALVRKIGIERVLKELHAKIIDTQDTYQLVNLDLGDEQQRPYLKMLNPSTEEWHIEGVPPDICSVNEAIAWRNQTKEKPNILT